jgi:DNA-binding LacI/PurR family transcriptional regulator
VATAAGVSASTASRALNDDPQISEATRKLVVRIARKLGYQKNAVATELMRAYRLGGKVVAHREALALLSHYDPAVWNKDKGLEHYPQMFDGIRSRAENLGYQLDTHWLHQPGCSFARLGSILKARGIRGVIVGPLPERDRLTGFPWKDFAAVALGYMLDAPALHRVQNNMYDNMSIVLEKLIRLGHRRIGFVTHSKVEDRLGNLSAARFALHLLGLPQPDFIPVLATDWAGDPAFERWLREYQPDAVIGQMDYVLPVLKKFKRRDGGPVSFAWLAAQINQPEIGGTVPRHKELGAAALDLLASLVSHGDKGVPDEQRTILISGVWRKGSTVFDMR